MVLSRAAIAELIPHDGAMCLLEEVVASDSEGIVCRATSHRDAANPLRESGILHAVCGIEYAAQTMAVHGALMSGSAGGARSMGGMLAAARDVVFNVERLDDVAEDLLVSARRLVAEREWLLYEFALHAGQRELMRGRATVSLAAFRKADG